MCEPNAVTRLALEAARDAAVAGVNLLELDAIAERTILEHGGRPNFKLEPGYKHTICANVNDVVVHGVPTDYVLQPGDIVSIDAGAIIEGWNGDSALTVVVPDPDAGARFQAREELSRHTRAALWHGIAALARASHLNEVGAAIEDYITENTEYSIVSEYIGHGIGRAMHEEPPVFNNRVPGNGPAVKPGLVVAIEPIIAAGSPRTAVDKRDGWSVRTTDGSDSCQWEHTVAVHRDGIWVLTAADGGAAGLAPFGITPTPIA